MIYLIYILKSSACLAIFLLFYKLVLEREKFHRFKRYYLLCALLVSAAIPLISFPTYVQATSNVDITLTENAISTISNTSTNFIAALAIAVYLIGVFIMSLRFFFNLNRMRSRILKNPKIKSENFINVLVHQLIAPHTFFRFLFFNEIAYRNHKIPKEVILHEQAHAKQLHSIDILIIEFAQIIFWFNPLIYHLKNNIKLNHEFLADQAVMKLNINKAHYQNILLNYSSIQDQPILANAINYSSIKKRITVMKSQTSKPNWLKAVFIVPLLALTLFSFSSRKVIELIPEKDNSDVVQSIELNSEMAAQKEASHQEVEEYNKLASKYHAILKTENKRILASDIERLKYLYGKMSPAQRESAQPFPDFPAPPPAPDAPVAPTAKVADLPPSPPLPDNASPEEKKAYEKASKARKEAAEKALYKKSTKANTKAKLAAKERSKEKRALMSESRAKLTEARQLAREQRKAAMNGKKTKRKAAQEQLSEARKLEMEQLKKARELERRKRRSELAQLKELKRPKPPKNPMDHVIEMAKKDAKFYLEGREISSDLAIETIKSNKQVSIETKGKDSNNPKVYISVGKPVVKD